MPCLYFAAMLLQPLPSPPCSLPCPHSNHFLTSHWVKLPPSPPHTSQHALFAKYIFGLRILPYPDDHFTPVPTAARSNSAEPAARHSTPPHFLVLTSLSISALRVLCTSSPSLSISAFKRSFCSVSSCTFLSFSCSLSLRLFLAEEE